MARLLTLMLLCSALMGCELVADFDRSKIPDERPGRDGGPERDAASTDDAGDDGATPGEEDAGSDHDAGTPDEDAG